MPEAFVLVSPPSLFVAFYYGPCFMFVFLFLLILLLLVLFGWLFLFCIIVAFWILLFLAV